ncbi:MAG TPA: methyltransferase dimerization domain-containing protein, partial [Mycobacterium sp.]|nr:methyltransferase dimerization domain-containing protein [Mycobacterium sp.]
MGADSPRARLGALVFGAMAAEVVFTAARLRIADVIVDGHYSTQDIAARVGADIPALTRLLRALAALGLLSEPVSGQFRLTEIGRLLETTRADSMHAFVRAFGDPTMLSAWSHLDAAVLSGNSQFEKIYGT